MSNLKKLKAIKCYFWVAAMTPLEAFIAPVVVLFYIEHLGINFMQYSNYIALLLIINLLLEVPMGVVSDKIGRRNALIIGNTIYCLALWLILSLPSITTLMVASILFGVGSTLASGNLQSIGYEAFESNGASGGYGGFLSKIGSFSIAVSALAALVGGYLADHSIVLPMIADIAILCIKIVLGVFLLVIVWPKENHDKRMGNNSKITRKSLSEMKDVLLNKRFILSVALGSVCFALLRTSLNFYQPILSEAGWSGSDLGSLFAIGIVLSAVISFYYSRAYKAQLTLKFGFKIMCLGSIVGAVLFSLDVNYYWWFFIGFVVHQVLRVIVPSIESHSLQSVMPNGYPHRTTAVSFSFLVKALVTSTAVAVTGFFTASGMSFQFVLVGLHIFAFVILLAFYLSPFSSKESLSYE